MELDKKIGKVTNMSITEEGMLVDVTLSPELLELARGKKKTKEDILREELKDLKIIIREHVDDYLIPYFKDDKSLDYFGDKQINLIRENLYDLMCKRRELLGVNEYESN